MDSYMYQHFADKHGSEIAKMTFGLAGYPAKFFKLIGKGDEKGLQRMLDRGVVDIETTNEIELTGLGAAIEEGHIGIIKMLLEKGAKFDIECTGFSPIIFAITRHRRLDIVELLLKYGSVKEGESSALQYACSSGHLDIVNFFLKRGADMYKLNEVGANLLHLAAESGNVEIVKMFIDKFDLKATDKDGKTALNYAAIAGYEFSCDKEDVTQLLIDRGANIHAKFSNKFDGNLNVLQHACRYGCGEGAKILLENGADVKITGKDGKSLVKVASEAAYFGPESATMEKSPKMVVTRYFAKLKSANLPVPEQCLKDIVSDEKLNAFLAECETELEGMKGERLTGSFITYFEFLMLKDQNELADIVKNAAVVRVLKNEDVKTKFPIYASLLKYQLKRGLYRKLLLDQFNNVSNNDLRKLIRARNKQFTTEICDVNVN